MKLFTLAIFGALCALSTSAHAQVRTTPGADQMEAKRMAWQTWRSNHGNVLDLQHTVISLSDMQTDPTLRASSDQAKDLLKIINTWRKKSALSDKRAKLVNSEIKTLMSPSQLGAIKKAPRRYTSPPIPKETGLPGSRRHTFNSRDFPWPKDYNPLKPETIPFPVQRKEMHELLKSLVKRLNSY